MLPFLPPFSEIEAYEYNNLREQLLSRRSSAKEEFEHGEQTKHNGSTRYQISGAAADAEPIRTFAKFPDHFSSSANAIVHQDAILDGDLDSGNTTKLAALAPSAEMTVLV